MDNMGEFFLQSEDSGSLHEEGYCGGYNNSRCKSRGHRPVIRKTVNSSCDVCEGKMILRSGKYGPLMGCSNYPDCQFTANI